jgi:hypothetical protein
MTKGTEATIAERIARSREAVRRARALLNKPVPDRTDMWRGEYVGLSWRGQKISIPKWKVKRPR